MDVIDKNMILTTTETLLNYGSLDTDMYTLIGQVSSELPFTLTIVADGIVIPYVYDVAQTVPFTISYNTMSSSNQFPIPKTTKFELHFDTSNEKSINLKLYKPYPISPVFPN